MPVTYQPIKGFLPCLAISTLSSQTAKPVARSVSAMKKSSKNQENQENQENIVVAS